MTQPPPNVPSYAPPGENKPQGLAITSLVLGVLSFLFCFIFGWLSPLLAAGALVTGIMARNGVKAGTQGGGGMALAGIILGIVNLALFIIGLIVTVIFGAALFGFFSAVAEEAERQQRMNQGGATTEPVEMFRLSLEWAMTNLRALMH